MVLLKALMVGDRAELRYTNWPWYRNGQRCLEALRVAGRDDVAAGGASCKAVVSIICHPRHTS